MKPTRSDTVRFNREYFGFIVGYSSGDIVLARESAQPLLEAGASREELEVHLLDKFDVRPGFYLQTPPLVWLELTRRCNLTCDHCYISGGQARENEMAPSEFFRLIEEMAAMGVWGVAFTGGEPTLHSEFANLVRHARKQNLLVGIATNGMFLSRHLLESLPRDGVIISISLDNLHLPGSRESREFELVSQAINRCQEMGFMTNIMTNTHRENMGDLAGMMKWAKEHGVSIRSIPFSPVGRGKEHKYLENTPEDVEQAAAFWLQECEWEHEYHERAGLCVGAIFNYGLSLSYMTRRCASGRFLCYICADGTVYPCTLCAAEEVLSPGSVRHASFDEVWRSTWEIREFSWDNFKDTCSTCPINDPIYFCTSRCPAMSYARNGSFFGCGASPFEKVSTVYRTGLLEQTRTGKQSNRPLVPKEANRSTRIPLQQVRSGKSDHHTF